MRALIQRVTEARVRVGDRLAGEIGQGLLVLLGVAADDGADDVRYVAGKVRDVRVFDGVDGKGMDRSVLDVGGAVLVVSPVHVVWRRQEGPAPVIRCGGPPERARGLYEDLVRELRTAPMVVATGEFQATMHVELVNDGPVTILIESKKPSSC